MNYNFFVPTRVLFGAGQLNNLHTVINAGGDSMVVGTCTSEHSMEHAMSAFHHDLSHGAGLIMISNAYFGHWFEKHVCDERFIDMAKMLGMTE